ncbi:MAG: protein kinase [Ruminococcus sp.]|nr:protein kinase [Ruminococcus sp.]
MQLANALCALQRLGIVHRDIKEDNVIAANDGTVKLTDFDISKVYTEGKSRDTVLLGTATYAPPEQFGLAQTDHRSELLQRQLQQPKKLIRTKCRLRIVCLMKNTLNST